MKSSSPTTIKLGCMLYLWAGEQRFIGAVEVGSPAEVKPSPAAGISSHGGRCLIQRLLVSRGTKSGASPQRHRGPQEPQTFGASAGHSCMHSVAWGPSRPAAQDVTQEKTRCNPSNPGNLSRFIHMSDGAALALAVIPRNSGRFAVNQGLNFLMKEGPRAQPGNGTAC